MPVGERVSGVFAGQSLAWLLVRLALFRCCAPPLWFCWSPQHSVVPRGPALHAAGLRWSKAGNVAELGLPAAAFSTIRLCFLSRLPAAWRGMVRALGTHR